MDNTTIASMRIATILFTRHLQRFYYGATIPYLYLVSVVMIYHLHNSSGVGMQTEGVAFLNSVAELGYQRDEVHSAVVLEL